MGIRATTMWLVLLMAFVVASAVSPEPASAAVPSSDESAIVLDDDDDDPIPPIIRIDNVEVGESAETITFTISKDIRTPLDVPVKVTTEGIEALPDIDYIDKSVTLLLSRKKNVSDTVTFDLLDDAIAEGNETFAVVLSTPAWARVDENGGIGTIIDNDKAGIRVDIDDGVLVAEGGAADAIAIQLLSPPQASVTIDVTTDAAQVDVDPLSLVFDAANWSQPQTISVSAVADGVVEDYQHVAVIRLTVSSPDPFYDQRPLDPIDVTIEDDDAPSVAISGPAVGIPAQSVTFEAVINTKAAAYSWEAFMNGNPVATGAEAAFTFAPAAPGNYVVSVVVTDSTGDEYRTFTDYAVLGDIANSPFESDVIWLAETGITKGCNPPLNDMFCPDAKLTRGQMAAFLVRFFDLTDSGDGDAFVDDDDSIFEHEIDILAAAGLTTGCNPPESTLYCPDALVNRGQMAAFLSRAFDLTDDGGGDLFVDDDVWIFESEIDKLATAGITRGCNPPVNDKYCPADDVTRGQMAAFLHRAAALLTE